VRTVTVSVWHGTFSNWSETMTLMGHRSVAAAQGIAFDMPVAVTPTAFTQGIDVTTHRFE
jgi:hypothetical protein